MLYLLGGENTYQSSLRLKELQEDFLERYGGEVKFYNADEVDDPNKILADADSFSLFEQSRLIIIKRLFSTPTLFATKFYDYLKATKPGDFILWEDHPIDKRKGLYKYIKRKGVVEEFEKLKPSQLKTWVSRYLKERIAFDPECVETLIMKMGDDQMLLSSTLDNLVILVKSENRRKLLKKDIEHFVTKTAEENIWEFVDAISTQNKSTALSIMECLVRERGDFVMIIGMLARQLRILSLVKSLLDVGRDYASIVSTLKLHPFVIRKAISHSRNFTMKQLQKLYFKLVRTDLAVKEGRFEERLALDLFVAAI